MQGFARHDFWTAIAGFSVGVEVGHQAIVVPLLALLFVCRRIDLRNSWKFTPHLVRALSVLIAAGGLHFLIGALESAF